MEIQTSNNKKNQALRFDSGKNRLSLIPTSLVEEVGKVMTVGAQKYAPNNWRSGMDWSRCVDSFKRHVLAWEKGEDIDPETGCMHLAHAVCNLAFLIEYSSTHPELDDRWSTKVEKERILRKNKYY